MKKRIITLHLNDAQFLFVEKYCEKNNMTKQEFFKRYVDELRKGEGK